MHGYTQSHEVREGKPAAGGDDWGVPLDLKSLATRHKSVVRNLQTPQSTAPQELSDTRLLPAGAALHTHMT